MQIKVSPELVALLEADEVDEPREVLIRLWREMKQEVEHQKGHSIAKVQDVIVPKRARFSFD